MIAAEKIQSVSLFEVLPDACFQDPRFGQTPGFEEWEREVAEPELHKKGWSVLSWHPGEGDGIGPNTRYALCVVRGHRWRLVYG